MGSLSDYIENKVVDHVTKVAPFIQPTNLYVGLSTADPLDNGSGLAEPVLNGYARVMHNSWDPAANRATENTGTITYPEATGPWGIITHFAIFDDPTAGNLIGSGALSATKTIGLGDNASFQDGAIDITFTVGGIGDFLANAVLDHIFKTAAYDNTLTGLFIAVSTVSPGDDGSTILEPTEPEYARVDTSGGGADWWEAGGLGELGGGLPTGATENRNAITFPQALLAWGVLTHFGIFDATTGGNFLCYGTLDNPRAIGQNDTPSFAPGALDITMD